MKKLFFYTVLFLSSFGGYAQTDSVYIWNKWCARKDTLLLFNGGNNVIQIYCRGMKPDEIKLKSMDVTLRIGNPEIKGDTLSVMAMPYPEKSKNKNMRLAVMYKKTGKMIKTVNFCSDSIPKLIARVGKLTSNEVSKKDLLAQSAVFAVFPNSLYSYPYRIKQYVFKMTTPTTKATLNGNGIFITQLMQQQIKDAPAGTIAEFTGIKATCPECATRTLDDVNIKIK